MDERIGPVIIHTLPTDTKLPKVACIHFTSNLKYRDVGMVHTHGVLVEADRFENQLKRLHQSLEGGDDAEAMAFTRGEEQRTLSRAQHRDTQDLPLCMHPWVCVVAVNHPLKPFILLLFNHFDKPWHGEISLCNGYD
jgi:hypothetical protein